MQTKSFVLVPEARSLRYVRAEHELTIKFENKDDAFSQSSPFPAIRDWNVVVRTSPKTKDRLDVLIITMNTGSTERVGSFKSIISLSVCGREMVRSDTYMHCYTIDKASFDDSWDGTLVIVATVIEHEVTTPIRDVKPVWRAHHLDDDDGSTV